MAGSRVGHGGLPRPPASLLPSCTSPACGRAHSKVKIRPFRDTIRWGFRLVNRFRAPRASSGPLAGGHRFRGSEHAGAADCGAAARIGPHRSAQARGRRDEFGHDSGRRYSQHRGGAGSRLRTRSTYGSRRNPRRSSRSWGSTHPYLWPPKSLFASSRSTSGQAYRRCRFDENRERLVVGRQNGPASG